MFKQSIDMASLRSTSEVN